MRRCLTIAALFVQGFATPAGAQIPVGLLEPGSRIRVVDDRGGNTVGALALLRSDSLTVNAADGIHMRTFALSTVTALQVSRERHRQVAKTTLITTAVSAIVFGVLSATSYKPCHPQGLFDCLLAPDSRGSAFEWGLAGGAIIGLPVGLLVGLTVKYDRWADVALPGTRPASPAARVARLPGGRIGVGLSIPFGGKTTGR